MVRQAAILVCAGLSLLPVGARAGAWTLPEGTSQILVGATYSRASEAFDHRGRASEPVAYDKILVQLDGEYGLNDWLTLVLAPEFAHAQLVRLARLPERANDAAVEAGVRLRLLKDVGIVSAQLTAKSAGAFDMSVSVDDAPGRQLELRLLYGTNFLLFGRPGFFDAEIAQRWIAGARADEVPVDLTFGLRVTQRSRLLLQSFNTIAEGNAQPPYSYYRLHKVSLSVVTDIRPGLCLEGGGFLVVAGDNALAERGAILRFWLKF